MASTRPIKIINGEEIRRIAIEENEQSMANLRKVVSAMLSVPEPNVNLKFKDADGDLITIGSDEELRIAFTEAKEAQRIVRFLVDGPATRKPNKRPDAIASIAKKPVLSVSSKDEHNKPCEPMAEQLAPPRKWRPNGPRGCRGSGKSKKQTN